MQQHNSEQNQNAYFDELLLIAKRVSVAEQQAVDEKLNAARVFHEAAQHAADEKLAAIKRYSETEKLIAAEKLTVSKQATKIAAPSSAAPTETATATAPAATPSAATAVTETAPVSTVSGNADSHTRDSARNLSVPELIIPDNNLDSVAHKPKNTLFTTSPAKVRQILDEAEASSSMPHDQSWRREDLHSLEDADEIVRKIVEESQQEATHFMQMQAERHP